MAKSKIAEPAFSLFSETMLDMNGMAVAGFPGAEEDNPVAHKAVHLQEHCMSPEGKTVILEAKQSGKLVFATEYAPDPLELLIAEEEVQSKMFPLSVFHVNKLVGKIKDARSMDAVSELAAQAELILIAMKEVFIGDNALQITLNLGDDLAIVTEAKKANLAKKTTTVTGMLNGKKASAILPIHA